MDAHQYPGYDKLSPGSKRVLEILTSDIFRRDLSELISEDDPFGDTRLAFRLKNLEGAEFGYITIECTPKEGKVRKVYRDVCRDESDSCMRCSPTFAMSYLKKLQRLGWTQCDSYIHQTTEDMLGSPLDLEACVREPDGTCRTLRLYGAELAPNRKIRRLGRRLEKLILNLLQNTRQLVYRDLKKT